MLTSTNSQQIPNISSVIVTETSAPMVQSASISSTGFLIPITIATIVIVSIIVAISVPIAVNTGKKNNKKSIINKNMTNSEFQYGCFVDAGSSSSRVYIYNWIKEYSSNIPIITQFNRSERYTPALAKTSNDEEIENVVNIYINFCENGINYYSNNNANIEESPFF